MDARARLDLVEKAKVPVRLSPAGTSHWRWPPFYGQRAEPHLPALPFGLPLHCPKPCLLKLLPNRGQEFWRHAAAFLPNFPVRHHEKPQKDDRARLTEASNAVCHSIRGQVYRWVHKVDFGSSRNGQAAQRTVSVFWMGENDQNGPIFSDPASVGNRRPNDLSWLVRSLFAHRRQCRLAAALLQLLHVRVKPRLRWAVRLGEGGEVVVGHSPKRGSNQRRLLLSGSEMKNPANDCECADSGPAGPADGE